MRNTIEAGKTLLVDGPASVAVDSGKVEVFGYLVRRTDRIVIRVGKRLPFTVIETAEVTVSLGEGSGVEVVEGNSVPPSWGAAFDALKKLEKKPAVAMVVGGADSGKSSLCTYLANRLMAEGCSVAIVDGDMGQADIGPPCTVAYTRVTKPVTDLFALQAENAFFMGVTSPSEAADRALEGVEQMKTEAAANGVDYVLVNTDGWVAEEAAITYKRQMVKALVPDAIVAIKRAEELTFLLGVLRGFQPINVDTPASVKERTREKRRELRELGYTKYFAGSKVKVWHMKKMAVEPKMPCQSLQNCEGTLLGLHDAQRKFLGLGVLKSADCSRMNLRVWTAVAREPAVVVLGKVRLDEKLHEVSSFNFTGAF